MINSRWICIIWLLFPISLYSQPLIGKWRSHLSYYRATAIAAAGDKIFCATTGGLFYYNTKDNSINKFSREDGLSDTEITTLKYSSDNNTLIIAYSTSNIDVVTENSIFNFKDIERFQVLGDKSIYNITFRGEYAYLSAGFGIVVLDVKSLEFKDTYDKIGPEGVQVKVNDVAFSNNQIFATTDRGIFKADLNAPNLKDYNYWEQVTDIEGHTGSFTSIVSRGNKIYVIRKGDPGKKDLVYVWDGTIWQVYNKFTDNVCRKLIANGDTLIILRQFHLDVVDIQDNMIRDNLFIGSPVSADFDNQGIFWIADNEKGMLRNPNTWELEPVVPDGPLSVDLTDLSIKDGKLIAVPGGPTSVLNNQFRIGEVYRFEKNSWYNWKGTNVHDFYRIAINPLDPSHFFIGSWGGGLFEFKDGEFVNNYGEGNSTLQTIVPGSYIRIGGMAFDQDNNLWIANSGVPEPVSVLTKNGEWVGFPVSSIVNAPNIGRMIVTRDGHKWMILSGGRGLFVLDDRGTLKDFSDDRYRKLSVMDKNNGVITNDILALAEDREGTIWLGSSKGVILYYSPGRIFTDDNFFAQQIIIPSNDGTGTGNLLLGSEAVTAIAVDGANRKWLGTRNAGVFLVSADGMEEIHSFNTGNSPLLSNSIIAISIDEKSGEVFFGTDKGIISYRSDAIAPGDFFNNVYVYPNPVREDYQGDIVITGLVAETFVKITDISGNLVFETRSLGGQALWDGNDFRGHRVKTGVYLVFCSDREGTMAVATKVLVIN